MKKIQIQYHCTPPQARQLYDAVKAAGLEYPPIDWAFYISTKGSRRDDIWTGPCKVDYCKKWHANLTESDFIPCPTLAEIMKLSMTLHISRDFNDWFENFVRDIKNFPAINRDNWSNLQNKENE